MNRVTLTGRIARDVELKKSSNGKSFVANALAYRPVGAKDKDAVCYIDVAAFNKTAEFFGKYISKGNRVLVEGVLNERSYQNKDGKKVSKTEVLIEHIESLEPREKEAPEAPTEPVDATDLPDEDLPF